MWICVKSIAADSIPLYDVDLVVYSCFGDLYEILLTYVDYY